jgi:hypothetical protein
MAAKAPYIAWIGRREPNENATGNTMLLLRHAFASQGDRSAQAAAGS